MFSIQIRTREGGRDLSVNIRKFSKGVTAKQRYSMVTWANTVIKEAKNNLRVVKYHGKRPNRLRDSIGDPSKEGVLSVSPKGDSITVGTKVPYAIHVEYGARPHKIPRRRKRKGKWLRFVWKKAGNKVVYSKQVFHPGIQEGKFYMSRAFIRANEEVSRELRKPIGEVITRRPSLSYGYVGRGATR